MEQIYTIPVNEAFEVAVTDEHAGCPFCALYNKLETTEIDTVLGASMMEPDIRIKTNEQGFCRTHFDQMFAKKNALSLALILESHLDEVKKRVHGALSLGGTGAAAMKSLAELEGSCYVCGRIHANFEKMVETAVLLWEKDEAFRQKTAAQHFFCLPHYRRFLECAKARMNKRTFADFYAVMLGIEESYLASLKDDVSWFCKKFDYRYDAEPWYNAKDSTERAIRFLASDIHKPEEKTK